MSNGEIKDGVHEDGDRSFVNFNGKTYELGAMEASDYILLRDRLRSRRRQPALAIADEIAKLPKELTPAERSRFEEKMYDRAYSDILNRPEDRVPSPKEVAEWIDDTDSGAVYSLYVMLTKIKENPEVTEELTTRMYEMLRREAVIKIRDRISARRLAVEADQIHKETGWTGSRGV